MQTIAIILRFLIPLTPLITVPICWFAFKKKKAIVRVVFGFVMGIALSLILLLVYSAITSTFGDGS